MSAPLLVVGGLGLLVLYASRSKKNGAPSKKRPTKGGKTTDVKLSDAERIAARWELRQSAEIAAVYFSMPGLPNFLDLVAYKESYYNPTVENRQEAGRPDAARGLFQLRPSSTGVDAGLRNSYAGGPIRLQVAAATGFILRSALHVPDDLNDITYFDIARAWARPSLIKDFDLAEQRSRDAIKRFEASATAGRFEGVLDETVFPEGYPFWFEGSVEDIAEQI